MLLSRIIFVSISVLFSCYCLFVAFFTFFGKNVATYHLQKIYLLGFAAVYAILSPFGIAGIIGGLNRKKALIKGFMMQYWIATIAFIGLSVGLVIMAGSSKRDTFLKCKGEFPPTSEEDVREICVNRVLEYENITKIASYVQGGVLVFFGIFVTFFGIREFLDIKMDEETSGLLDKAAFNNKEETESSTSSISDHNQLLPPENALNRNLSIASSAYSNSSSNSNGSINRYPPMTPYSGGRNMTNASALPSQYPVPSSNYPYPNATNLSRNPTNASNYTTITTASSTSSSSKYSNRHYPPSSNNYQNVNRLPTGGGISRYPTNASNYSSISSNSNRSNYSNYSNNNMSRRNYNGTPPPQVPPQSSSLHQHQYHPPPPSSSSRPLQQYSSISNKPSPQYNNNNAPPLTINDQSIIEEEDYDDYNNYNYENNNNKRR